MFDALTAQILRSAPALPDLNPEDLPKILTRHYAQLVAKRLQGPSFDDTEADSAAWPLERIADAYEIVASLETEVSMRQAASFVAATAHQILSRKRVFKSESSDLTPSLDRDKVDPSIAAALLFLAAEQYADANEAALSMPRFTGASETLIVGRNVKDLASGRLESILRRANGRRSAPPVRRSIQNRAFLALVSTLNEGIELLAASVLGETLPEDVTSQFDSPQSAFRTVIELSGLRQDAYSDILETELFTSYAGPHHLASLLLIAADGISQAALTSIPPPMGADGEFWKSWLRFRAKDTPFLWRNHREAIAKEFAQTGNSSVLILPTGAGKTTVSALKIAGTLARKKKVVFLAPTHALVEQLTDDLQSIFPSDKYGLQVSSDFDSLFIEGTNLQDIEVMTPERCLAMMSFEPNAFADVGLLVFDECHLLSPDAGKIGRALDGMLCVLTFNTVARDADLLFLSAMLKNGAEFAEWVAQLTGRKCVDVELLWKPSRQARGLVVYDQRELSAALVSAKKMQAKIDNDVGSIAKTIRSIAKKEVAAVPKAVWGLTHNWISTTDSHTFTAISEKAFPLGVGFKKRRLWATPNANQTAGRIATSAAASGIKTIIFVNTKADAISLARDVAAQIGEIISLNEREEKIWEALIAELGDAKHAIFGGANLGAVPHNSAMFRLERLLSESLFRRADGAKVIVATPTLAQGLNLPAQLALLAGDKRAGDAATPRESLQAHELLNAAARAGRAGHLANGVVLLIPEPLVTYASERVLSIDLKSKLSAILPEDDRCVSIRDPLEIVLDRISAGSMADRAVQYTVSRLAILEASDEQAVTSLHLLNRSFGAFLARRRNETILFDEKIDQLRSETKKLSAEGDALKLLISSQSGLPAELIAKLSNKLLSSVGSLPINILGWLSWVFDWLASDETAREYLLHDVRNQMLSAVGLKADNAIDGVVLTAIFPGIKGWLEGSTIAEIEMLLGGNPNSEKVSKRVCPRARDLVSNVIPRGVSFIIGVVSHVIDEYEIYKKQPNLDQKLVQSLSSAVRKGFDSVAKLQFAHEHKEILSRVQIHAAFRNSFEMDFGEFDE
ncbi:DEAD/DEAH box helicase [Methylobacterium komagatae]